MPHRTRRLVVAGVALSAALLAVGAQSATAGGSASTTFKGAFEFEGIANHAAGKGCRGAGAFGEAKAGARVTISERDAAGEFDTLGKGKLGKGKVVETADGDEICRMKFRVKAGSAPAADSVVYLEVKGLTFNVSFPAADVADGDLGTWRCEFSDNTCAILVGNG